MSFPQSQNLWLSFFLSLNKSHLHAFLLGRSIYHGVSLIKMFSHILLKYLWSIPSLSSSAYIPETHNRAPTSLCEPVPLDELEGILGGPFTSFSKSHCSTLDVTPMVRNHTPLQIPKPRTKSEGLPGKVPAESLSCMNLCLPSNSYHKVASSRVEWYICS